MRAEIISMTEEKIDREGIKRAGEILKNGGLVAFLFGQMTWLSRVIYAIIGLCGLYLISLFGRISAFGEE